MGKPRKDGTYSPTSLNGMVQQTLDGFADAYEGKTSGNSGNSRAS